MLIWKRILQRGGRFMKKLISAGLIVTLLFLVGCSSGTEGKSDEEYPKKDITLIVPFTAGGASDVQARIVEKYFKKEFGVGLIFQYKEGAGGEKGFTELAQAPNDGYTIGTINMPHIVLQPLGRETQFTYKDFDYIGEMVKDPQILAVKSDSEYNTLQDVLEATKKKKLTIGTVGTLTGNYMAALDLMKKANVEFEIVPFEGSADQVIALQGGHVDVIMGNLNDLARDKEQYKMLAISTEKPHEMLPDVKTFKEQGYDVQSEITRLFATPKGIDPKKLEILRKGFANIASNPEYLKEMKNIGQPECWVGGEELEKNIEKENAHYKELLEAFDLLKK